MTESMENTVYNPALYLRKHAVDHPNKIALYYPIKITAGKVVYRQLTYREIDEESDRAAYALQQANFRPGEKAVFMVKVGPELFVQVFALFKLGVIPVVVDPGMGIRRMLHCYHSVASENFVGIPVATLVRWLAPRMFASIRSAVTVFRGKIWGQNRLLKNVDVGQPFPIFEGVADSPALISFTTGSTGPAKAVECTQLMAQSMMEEMQSHAGITEKDVQLLTVPFFGVLGMMMGNTCVLPSMDPTRPADIVPEYLIQAIEDYKVTCMFASPSLLNALGRYGEKQNTKLETLRMVSCGGAPMTLGTMHLFRKMLAKEANFETTWGATEGLPLTSINIDTLLDDTKAGMESGMGVCIGHPVGRVKVRIMRLVDGPIKNWSDDLDQREGEVGELIVQGPNISPRYHRDEKSDRENKIQDGDRIWHRTGDLGWRDEQGRIWFCGRKSHQIKLSEQNVTLYSVQGEGVVNSHPAVYRSALVCAKDMSKGGENYPVICVELVPDSAQQDQDAIRDQILSLLAKHEATKFVKDVLFHPAFPVDIRHNAKIERHVLGEWATRVLGR